MDTALKSIELIPAQIKQVKKDFEALNFDSKYANLDLIAISGMGGSIYNYYILDSVFRNNLTKPLVRINNYGLPNYLNKNSLFIASSYSGTTEEVLYNTKLALEKGLNIIVYCSGGPLAEFARNNSLPLYQFEATFNPSLQPRMGQGYMLFGAIYLLEKLGYLGQDSLNLDFLEKLDLKAIRQEAKTLAGKVMGTELFFVSSDHLNGNAHILRNQTNETAKLYANYNLVPELNHHLMEGLKHPENSQRTFFFINSSLYQERNIKRMELTKEVVLKNGFGVENYLAKQTTELGQMVEVLIFGGYFSYELGVLYKEDPNKIPWVDYFKNKLGKF